MAKLRDKKEEFKELSRGKGNKALFKDDRQKINHSLHVLAIERSKLPLDLKWSAEEQKRRQEGDQGSKQKR